MTTEPLDTAVLAAIREDDARLVSQLPPRPEPPPVDLAHAEHPQTTLVRLSVDRRALLAERDRLAAEVATLRDQVESAEQLGQAWVRNGTKPSRHGGVTDQALASHGRILLTRLGADVPPLTDPEQVNPVRFDFSDAEGVVTNAGPAGSAALSSRPEQLQPDLDQAMHDTMTPEVISPELREIMAGSAAGRAALARADVEQVQPDPPREVETVDLVAALPASVEAATARRKAAYPEQVEREPDLPDPRPNDPRGGFCPHGVPTWRDVTVRHCPECPGEDVR